MVRRLVALLVVTAAVGCGGTSPAPQGTPLPPSKEVKSKGKTNVVADELPPPPKRN